MLSGLAATAAAFQSATTSQSARMSRETGMGATKIMVIRHAEKPGSYNGVQYDGVNNLGTIAGDNGAKHLVTLGWERAGGLVTLFAPPWGPRTSSLATPQFLFASDPIAKDGGDTSDEGPSERPYETLTALAARLSLTIDKVIAKATTPRW